VVRWGSAHAAVVVDPTSSMLFIDFVVATVATNNSQRKVGKLQQQRESPAWTGVSQHARFFLSYPFSPFQVEFS